MTARVAAVPAEHVSPSVSPRFSGPVWLMLIGLGRERWRRTATEEER